MVLSSGVADCFLCRNNNGVYSQSRLYSTAYKLYGGGHFSAGLYLELNKVFYGAKCTLIYLMHCPFE